MLSFSNSDIKKAVEKKYLFDKDLKRQIHEEIANFFLTIEDLSERKIEELPWQLEQAQMWDKLHSLLVDLNYFDRLYTGTIVTTAQHSKQESFVLFSKIRDESSLNVCVRISDAHKFDLFRYWRSLEKNENKYEAYNSYKTIIERGQVDRHILYETFSKYFSTLYPSANFFNVFCSVSTRYDCC